MKSEKQISDMVELLKKELDKSGSILLYYAQALLWTLNKYDWLGIKENNV
jgi:hypothetical protein